MTAGPVPLRGHPLPRRPLALRTAVPTWEMALFGLSAFAYAPEPAPHSGGFPNDSARLRPRHGPARDHPSAMEIATIATRKCPGTARTVPGAISRNFSRHEKYSPRPERASLG
jgi:hypothetical protein